MNDGNKAEANIGLPLKKGQLVEVNWPDLIGIYRVEEDVEWNNGLEAWGSVRLEGVYPPIFTHKGGIKLISANTEVKESDE